LDNGFEGAIVLEPEPGIYLDDPISVLDYASLYPSSIIEKNLSHETFICTREEIDKHPDKFNWLSNIPHNIISYDDYNYEMKGKTLHKTKADTITTCYFAKQEGEAKGIIPTILDTLLNERRKTRKKIKQTDNEDKKKVLDGLQLAYKVTANSVYGQMGAKTSSICFKKIAACTTSIGRQRIYDAREGVKEWAIAEKYEIPEVVYGDTDSVFVKFSRKHKDTGEILEGKEALQYCIDCGIKAGKWITKHKLYQPQDLEYEKTFHPFILISKKRYTGDKYEESAQKLKERTSMGIVMKRRDNAAIVKYVFGNIIEIIMNQKSIDLAIKWLKNTLQEIKNGSIDKSMFIISKSLSGYYKNPEGIAHKVLADRMAERNPGNKPKPNDRIPYMYQVVDTTPIITGHKQISQKVNNGTYKNGKPKTKTIKIKGPPKLKKRKILQGDRIEHPDFMEEKNIPIDYSFYISNQIMNPVKQVLDLEKEETETNEIFKPFI
jgi:DNA polymerase elongation subunit (family B)